MYHLMKEEDYKHTWVLPKSAFYIKLYLWYWMADASEITFCKLFWGYALMLPFFPFRVCIGVGRTVGKVVNGILQHTSKARKLKKARQAELDAAEKLLRERDRCEKSDKIYKARRELPETVDPTNRTTVALMQKKRPKPPHIYHGRIQAGVEVKMETNGREPEWIFEGTVLHSSRCERCQKIRHTFGAPGIKTIQLRTWDDENEEFYIIDYTFEVHEGPSLPSRVLDKTADVGSLLVMYGSAPVKFIGRWLKRGLFTALAAAPFFGLYELITNWGSFGPGGLSAIGHFGSVVGPWAAAGFVGVAFAVVLVWLALTWGVVEAVKDVVIKPSAEGVTHGTLGFLKMLKIGYKSVKGNTCPRVQIEGEGDDASV